jgi:LmbE family N-acetylglucosaminyl deacetylase
LVITIFAGRPPADVGLSAFAQTQHLRWGSPEDVIAARWSEDQAALSVLGADYLRLDYLDCIYRGQGRDDEPEWYYASEEAIFGPVHPSEQSLPVDLATTLGEFIPPGEGSTVYAPLTVGNHVDHQLTFFAALILRTQGWQVRCYEDYPYVEAEEALATALVARGVKHWHPTVMPLDEDALEAKIRAIACYQSQLEVLFGSAEAMPDRVRNFAICAEGEQMWQPDQVAMPHQRQ